MKEEKAKLTKVISIPPETSIEQLIDILRSYPSQAKVKIPGPLGMVSPIAKLQIELETEF